MISDEVIKNINTITVNATTESGKNVQITFTDIEEPIINYTKETRTDIISPSLIVDGQIESLYHSIVVGKSTIKVEIME